MTELILRGLFVWLLRGRADRDPLGVRDDEAAAMTDLTAEDVKRRVTDILNNGYDHEAAHFDEDALLAEIIRQLAATSEVAAAVVPLLDTDRTRWFA